jgi:hypothetical protein
MVIGSQSCQACLKELECTEADQSKQCDTGQEVDLLGHDDDRDSDQVRSDRDRGNKQSGHKVPRLKHMRRCSRHEGGVSTLERR